MNSPLLNKLIQVRCVYGIEIILGETGIDWIFICHLKLKGKKVLKETIAPLRDLDQLSQKIDKKFPVSVVFNGKGIVSRLAPPGKANHELLEEILPNAVASEYYINWPPADDLPLLSIARKEKIAGLINLIERQGFQILGFQVGYHELLAVVPLIDPGIDRVIATPTGELSFDRNNLLANLRSVSVANMELQGPEYEVGDQYVKFYELISFATALGLLTNPYETRRPQLSEEITGHRHDFRKKQITQLAVFVTLGLLLTVLLVNYLIYQHYYQQNKNISESQLAASILRTQNEKSEQHVKEAAAFIEKNNWNSPYLASIIADKIASLVPSNATLSELTIYPRRKSFSTTSQENAFLTDTVVVSGYCKNPLEVNQFINNLKNISFIKQVALNSYVLKQEDEGDNFSLQIILKK